MCISARASILSFTTNLFSCLLLVRYGNKKLYYYNLITSYLLIYVSLMQFVDFGIWVDLDCKKGSNKVASFLGPILNFTQPLVMFGLIYYLTNYTEVGKNYYKNNLKSQEGGGFYDHLNITKNKFNFIKGINLIYTIIVVIVLLAYYGKAFTTNPEFLCSTQCDITNILKWNWYNSKIDIPISKLGYIWNIYIFNHLAINPKSNYVKFTLVFFYALLFLSRYFKKGYTAEIWCYIVNFGALFLLLIQKILPDDYFY